MKKNNLSPTRAQFAVWALQAANAALGIWRHAAALLRDLDA